MIYAAATLHNFRISRNVLASDEYEGDTSDEESEIDNEHNGDETDVESQVDVREVASNRHFSRQSQFPGDLYTLAGHEARENYVRNHF